VEIDRRAETAVHYHVECRYVPRSSTLGLDLDALAVTARRAIATTRVGYSTCERRSPHDGLFPQHDRILTEAIGNPTPIEIPLVPDKLLPKGDLPLPIQPRSGTSRNRSRTS